MKKSLLLACLLMLVAAQAFATIEIRIQNTAGGGDTGWIQCAGTSCAFVGTVGNYSLTSNISVRNDPLNPLLDMSYTATTANPSAGTILIETIADGYTVNAPGFELVADGNSTITTASNTVAGYGGNANVLCPAGVNPCTLPDGLATIASTSFSTPPTSYHFTGTSGGNTANPYSLGISFTINNPTSPGTASGDIMIDAVPEPASMLLLGSGLLGLARFTRKRRS